MGAEPIQCPACLWVPRVRRFPSEAEWWIVCCRASGEGCIGKADGDTRAEAVAAWNALTKAWQQCPECDGWGEVETDEGDYGCRTCDTLGVVKAGPPGAS